MPFKSEAQRKFMYAAEKRGDVPEGTAEHFAEATPKGKKLPKHVKDKNKSMVDALKAMTSKFDDEFLKGSLVEKVQTKDPQGPYRTPQESMVELSKSDEDEDDIEDSVDKGLTASVVNSIARNYRANAAVASYAEETNPDSYKSGIARQPKAVGFFRMTPVDEPISVPVRRIETPQAPLVKGEIYKSCVTCGKLNKSIEGDGSCSKCESLRSAYNSAPDFWRR